MIQGNEIAVLEEKVLQKGGRSPTARCKRAVSVRSTRRGTRQSQIDGGKGAVSPVPFQ
ncbi:hypothetical protein [Enterococcus faecalis]|uniref:hypothetical protein n=1 Tax=Enterococcus faecalis TaxID=1351 RepID=UPI0028929D22|nr:hypothetical protein [Enterococcus faecalis]